jgi:hypothetical protein
MTYPHSLSGIRFGPGNKLSVTERFMKQADIYPFDQAEDDAYFDAAREAREEELETYDPVYTPEADRRAPLNRSPGAVSSGLTPEEQSRAMGTAGDRLFSWEAPKESGSIFGSIRNWWGRQMQMSPEEADAVRQTSLVTGLPPHEITPDMQAITGQIIHAEPNAVEFAGELTMYAGVVGGAVAAPVLTAAGFAGFAALDHIGSLTQLVPDTAGRGTKDLVRFADIVLKVLALGKIGKIAKQQGAKIDAKVEQTFEPLRMSEEILSEANYLEGHAPHEVMGLREVGSVKAYNEYKRLEALAEKLKEEASPENVKEFKEEITRQAKKEVDKIQASKELQDIEAQATGKTPPEDHTPIEKKKKAAEVKKEAEKTLEQKFDETLRSLPPDQIHEIYKALSEKPPADWKGRADLSGKGKTDVDTRPPLLQEIKVEPEVKADKGKGKTKVKKTTKGAAVHGTDVDALESILSEGVRQGSAVDFSNKQSWASGYPIQVELIDATKGKYIAHNKYHTLGETAKVKKVTIDLNQYTDAGAEQALALKARLEKKHPEIKWEVLGEAPSDKALTVDNLTKFFEKEFELPTSEARQWAKDSIREIDTDYMRRYMGYNKPIRNVSDFAAYTEWLIAQSPETPSKTTAPPAKQVPKPNSETVTAELGSTAEPKIEPTMVPQEPTPPKPGEMVKVRRQNPETGKRETTLVPAEEVYIDQLEQRATARFGDEGKLTPQQESAIEAVVEGRVTPERRVVTQKTATKTKTTAEMQAELVKFGKAALEDIKKGRNLDEIEKGALSRAKAMRPEFFDSLEDMQSYGDQIELMLGEVRKAKKSQEILTGTKLKSRPADDLPITQDANEYYVTNMKGQPFANKMSAEVFMEEFNIKGEAFKDPTIEGKRQWLIRTNKPYEGIRTARDMVEQERAMKDILDAANREAELKTLMEEQAQDAFGDGYTSAGDDLLTVLTPDSGLYGGLGFLHFNEKRVAALQRLLGTLFKARRAARQQGLPLNTEFLKQLGVDDAKIAEKLLRLNAVEEGTASPEVQYQVMRKLMGKFSVDAALRHWDQTRRAVKAQFTIEEFHQEVGQQTVKQLTQLGVDSESGVWVALRREKSVTADQVPAHLRDVVEQAVPIVDNYLNSYKQKLIEAYAMEEGFPEVKISEVRKKTKGLIKDLETIDITSDAGLKKANRLIEKIAKNNEIVQYLSGIDYVPIPIEWWNAMETKYPAIKKKINSLKTTKYRRTLTLKSILETGHIRPEDADIRLLLGFYSGKVGGDLAKMNIVNSAITDGLAAKAGTKKAKSWRMMAGSEKTVMSGYVFHPMFAEYMEANFGPAQHGKISRFLNTVKGMQFINPVYMPFLDVMQATMWGTFKPTSLGKSFREVYNRSGIYEEAAMNNSFSKPMANPMASHMDIIHSSMELSRFNWMQHLDKIRTQTGKANVIGTVYTASHQAAWFMDRAIRLNTYKALKKSGMSPEQAGEMTALIHGDYANVPAKMRRRLNKILFTPTYKLAMIKMHKAMLEGIPQMAAALARNEKVFGKDASPKMKKARRAALALGLAVGLNAAKDWLMTSQLGFERDFYGRRYTKRIDTEEGSKELVLALSDPTNLSLKFMEKFAKSVEPSTNTFLFEAIRNSRFELHPVWRSIFWDVAWNQKAGGDQIYSKGDTEWEKGLKITSYLAREWVQLVAAMDVRGVDAETQKAMTREFSWLGSKALQRIVFPYVRGPEERSRVAKARALKEQLRRELRKGVAGPDEALRMVQDIQKVLRP